MIQVNGDKQLIIAKE